MKFTVQGSGQFPFDMLRFDRCFPVSSESAVAMDSSPPFGNRGMREVTLTTDAMVGRRHRRPTEARWESFGWRVISVED